MNTRYWRRAGTTLATRPLASPALISLGLILAFVLFWPLVSPYDPNEVNFDLSRQSPSPAHPFGTDQFGRDLMTRLAAGGRTTLLIVVIAVAIIAVLGISYGAISALGGRLTDAFLMRVLDGLLALPRIPIAIVILATVSLNAQNVQTVAVALGVVGWMLTARLVRGQLISLRNQDYVHAARALGARRRQLLRRHLLPNSSGILVVALLLELPTIVVGEAFLAVLGLGPQPPTATWGNIVDEGLHFGRVWQMTLGTAMIVLFVLTVNVIVDALGESLDPRSQVARRSPSVRRAEV
jgi:ABC-type dipeptide/oligopeptide/nickel transport system permease subunit